MGTETDQHLPRSVIPLTETQHFPEGTLGFSVTKEGRDYLQKLFKAFLLRSKYGERKVATIIADIHGNSEISLKEVELVRSALRRWNRDSQSEIFPKDGKKNQKIMARLEIEMLAVPEIREVMMDRSRTDEKHQIGEACARYYYRKSDLDSNEVLGYLHASFEGLFQAFTSWEHPVGSGTEEYRYLKTSGKIFYRLQSVPGSNFMAAQKFTKPPGETLNFADPGFVRTLHNGFAFPMENGSIHLHFFRLGPNFSRLYEVLESGMSQHRIPDDFDQTIGANRTWRASYQRFNASSEILDRESEEIMWEYVEKKLNVDKLLKSLDQRKWIL